MHGHISVRMALERAIMWDLDTAKRDVIPIGKGMHIVADPGSYIGRWCHHFLRAG